MRDGPVLERHLRVLGVGDDVPVRHHGNIILDQEPASNAPGRTIDSHDGILNPLGQVWKIRGDRLWRWLASISFGKAERHRPGMVRCLGSRGLA